jgi:peptide/nickel transport system substrate-binding protein
VTKEPKKDKKAFFAFFSDFSFWLKAKRSLGLSASKPVVLPDRQAGLDRKLVYSLSRSRIPSWRQLKYAFLFFSKREAWILRAAFVSLLISSSLIAWRYYQEHVTEVPSLGGIYHELVVGSPQYVNPLYSSLNDADADAVSLVFSSLYKNGRDSALVGDLASGLTISPDGKTYEVSLRKDAVWHDGRPVTADDVVFTFEAIKDQRYRSPLRQEFAGVSIEKKDDYAIRFVLENPYSSFQESLVFGILPFEAWSSVQPENALLSDLNIRPIGSGPYKFVSLKKSPKNGDIREYLLEPWPEYYGEKPKVSVSFISAPSFEEAVSSLSGANESVEGLSFLPYGLLDKLKAKTFSLRRLSIPQASGLFFNTKGRTAVQDRAVRRALAMAVDRESIIQQATNGEAVGISLAQIFRVELPAASSSLPFDKDGARSALAAAGWVEQEVSSEMLAKAEQDSQASSTDEAKAAAEDLLFLGQGRWRKKGDEYLILKIDTIDMPEAVRAAQSVKEDWEEIGVRTEVESWPASSFRLQVLAGRNFDVVWHSLSFGSGLDQYSFWHSSQAQGAGANISGFSSKEGDQLLEDARLNGARAERDAKYKRFSEIFSDEMPALLVFTPSYIYPQSQSLRGNGLKSIVVPADRFSDIADWYLETEKVFK